MIELPEAVVIARQITETLNGKRITYAVANASPHKFAWYTGDPAEYNDRLAGKVIGEGRGVGGHIEFDSKVEHGTSIRITFPSTNGSV